ncbi:hypothetical protein [Ensifer aridi]|uniref:hypothetical protein n=1 Tax=Ensifer aridi TaxID=1708715 RepID=UPI0004144499|nr:hypothetical protein [Ensifer aridi]
MRNRNDVGLYYLNDPVRIAETAAFKADQIRAVLDFNRFWFRKAEAGDPLAEQRKAKVGELIAKLQADGPHYDTIKIGEDALATIRALSIISLELQERFTDLGYEPGDFDEDDDEAA